MLNKTKVDLTFKNKEFEDYYLGIARDRLRIQLFADKSKANRATLLKACEQDQVFFTNYFVTTYNPRTSPSEIPFILFPEQVKMLRFFQECLDSKQWGTLNKCRYTGASYVSCLYILHALLFKEGMALALASNKADSVDKRNDPDCLFEKVIKMYRWLPDWLKTFDLELNRTSKLIVNPHTNTSLRGYSGTDIGRGGRSTIVFVDEAAHIEQDKAMIAALSENTDTTILISTPKGKNNEFYLAAVNDEYKHFTFRWQADPRRDPDWYESQKRKLGEEIAEQELNCNFAAGVEGILIKPKWVEACVHADIEWTDQRTAYNEGIIYAGVDLGKTRDASIVAIRQGNRILATEKFPPNELTDTALLVDNYIREQRVDRVIYDANGFGSAFGSILDQIRPDHKYEIKQYFSQGSVGDAYYTEMSIESKKFFYNCRARDWYEMKERMRKTYDFLKGDVDVTSDLKAEDLIILPNDPDLINDFSKPALLYRGGKILIESKEEMKKRGEASTDYADAVIMAFDDATNLSGWAGYGY